MASVTAFNDMMGQFLVELHKTFPDEKSIKKMLTSFDLLKSTSPRLLVNGFMDSVKQQQKKQHHERSRVTLHPRSFQGY